MSFTHHIESLERQDVPDWFRDAKLGIWSHWGPQAVPGAGDWYARNMYIQGHASYEHHIKNFGHPSKVGYKDIIPLWKAEKFDPEGLMQRYFNLGARYFVSMGVHHDNFDLWNSKHHRWNAVEMGPKRDIVSEWQKAARKYGLPFGVSEHLGASYTWFRPSHSSDAEGDLQGLPYDGENPQYADLYHDTGPISPEDAKKLRWYTDNPEWAQRWLARLTDLVESYGPDLLYSDGGLPFGEVGRELVARFFNNGGTVYNHKEIGSGEFFPTLSVSDVERGSISDIRARPWQCDTSIGDWYYSNSFGYKTTAQTIHLLADVVSKNGTMLLNVVQYPDGSLPPEASQILDEMTDWMRVNREAIHGTRPWKKFGEGPTTIEAGHFREIFPFTAQDFRFTTKGDVLYAISLGVPQGEVQIQSLGGSAERVLNVELLGHEGSLPWKQENTGLSIEMPRDFAGQQATVFKISLGS